MRTLDTTTAIAELSEFGFEGGKYPISVQQFDSVSEALALIGKTDEDNVNVEASQGALDAVQVRIGSCAARAGLFGADVVRPVCERQRNHSARGGRDDYQAGRRCADGVPAVRLLAAYNR